MTMLQLADSKSWRLPVLALAVSLFFAGCSGGGGGGSNVGGESDTTPPTVSAVSPAENATGIALNANVTATFSETMNGATITTSTFTLATTSGGTAAVGAVSLSGNTATLDPGADLAPSTSYTASITTGVQDAAGNALAANKVWSFTTGAAADTVAPSIVFLSPPDGSVGRSVNAPVSAIFSEAMNVATLSSSFTLVTTTGSNPVAGSVSFDPATFKGTFTPTSPLAGNTSYTATISTGATDLAGNPLALATTWSFTTQTPTIRHFSSKDPTNLTTTLGSFVAVDPYTQAKTTISNVPVSIVDADGDVLPLVAYLATAAFNNADNNLENQRRFAVVYSSGGSLVAQTVEQVTQGAPVTTTTFSNVSGITSGLGDGSANAFATDLCTIVTVPDYANVNNSLLIYIQAGADKICGNADDSRKFLHYGDGASASVYTLSADYNPQATIYGLGDTAGTGALLGVLAIKFSDGTLHKLSGTDLATVTPVTGTSLPTNVAEIQVLGHFGASGNMVLRVDDTIRTYNVAADGGVGTANSISRARATLDAANWLEDYTFAASSSGPSLYFADTTAGDATTIQTLDFNADPPTLNAAFYTGAAAITNLDNTSDRVVFQEGPNVRSIAKTGGAATTIGTGFALAAVSMQSGSIPRVYLNALGTGTAGAVDDDGSNAVTISNSRWLTGTISTTYSFANSRRNLRNVVLLTRASGAVIDAGATLTNYEAPTFISGEMLGTVPAGVTDFGTGWNVLSGAGLFTLEKGGAPMLLQGRNSDLSTDAYYLDPFIAGSLSALGTNGNGLNETPLMLDDFLDE